MKINKYKLIKRLDTIGSKLEKNVVDTHATAIDDPLNKEKGNAYTDAANELHEFLNSAKAQITLLRNIVKSNGVLGLVVFVALMVGAALGYLPLGLILDLF